MVVPCWIGLLPQSQNLPEQDPEGPNVRLGGEDPVSEGLWRQPTNRDLTFFAHPVVVVLVNVPGHPEIADLNHAPAEISFGYSFKKHISNITMLKANFCGREKESHFH